MAVYINGVEAISSIVQAALDLKANLASPALTGTVTIANDGAISCVSTAGRLVLQGGDGNAPLIQLWGSGSGSPNNMFFNTPRADGAGINRLQVAGGTDIVLVTWTSVNHVFGPSYTQYSEMAAPGAGAADTARVYAVVGGDTLTDLAAVFQDGTVAIFAQEVTPLDAPTFIYPSGTEVKTILRKEHPGLVKIVTLFPNGREFVLQEIQYHDPVKIAANLGAERPLPADWIVEDAKQRATRLMKEAIKSGAKNRRGRYGEN